MGMHESHDQASPVQSRNWQSRAKAGEEKAETRCKRYVEEAARSLLPPLPMRHGVPVSDNTVRSYGTMNK